MDLINICDLVSLDSFLQDLRNYQYSLSMVEGLRIHMEMGHSYIDIPKGSFNEVTLLQKFFFDALMQNSTVHMFPCEY